MGSWGLEGGDASDPLIGGVAIICGVMGGDDSSDLLGHCVAMPVRSLPPDMMSESEPECERGSRLDAESPSGDRGGEYGLVRSGAEVAAGVVLVGP